MGEEPGDTGLLAGRGGPGSLCPGLRLLPLGSCLRPACGCLHGSRVGAGGRNTLGRAQQCCPGLWSPPGRRVAGGGAPPGLVACGEPHGRPCSDALLTCQCPSVPFKPPGLRGNLSVIATVTIQLPWRKRVDMTKNASNNALWSSSNHICFLVFSALTRRICSEQLGFFLFLPKHFCRAFRGSREASVGSVVSQRAPERRPRLPRLVRPVASAAACGRRGGSRREHGHAGPQGAGLLPSRGPRSHGSPLVSRLLHRFFSLFYLPPISLIQLKLASF